MPVIDLRDKTGRRLKPKAPSIVLAQMLFPRDRQARHRWIALVGKQGRGRAEENVLRRVQGRAQPGALAGNALVCLIQLRRAGIDPSRAAVYVQAHMWFNLAASRYPPGEDLDSAVKNRDIVAERMTLAQMSEAQTLAREWRPK